MVFQGEGCFLLEHAVGPCGLVTCECHPIPFPGIKRETYHVSIAIYKCSDGFFRGMQRADNYQDIRESN